MCWRTFWTWWPIKGEIQCHGKLRNLQLECFLESWLLVSVFTLPVTGNLCQSPVRTIHFPSVCLTDGNKPAAHHGVIYGRFCSKFSSSRSDPMGTRRSFLCTHMFLHSLFSPSVCCEHFTGLSSFTFMPPTCCLTLKQKNNEMWWQDKRKWD